MASAAGAGVYAASALTGAIVFRTFHFAHIAVQEDILTHRHRKATILHIFIGAVLAALCVHCPAHTQKGNPGKCKTDYNRNCEDGAKASCRNVNGVSAMIGLHVFLRFG